MGRASPDAGDLTEHPFDLGLVVLRSTVQIFVFRVNAVDAVGYHTQLVEHGLFGHPKVRARVLGWDGALVAPEELGLLPVDLLAVGVLGEQLVETAGRGAAGENE